MYSSWKFGFSTNFKNLFSRMEHFREQPSYQLDFFFQNCLSFTNESIFFNWILIKRQMERNEMKRSDCTCCGRNLCFRSKFGNIVQWCSSFHHIISILMICSNCNIYFISHEFSKPIFFLGKRNTLVHQHEVTVEL